MGRVSLDPTQNVQGLILIKYFELVIQPHDGIVYILFIYFACMVSKRSLQDRTAISDLSGKNELCDLCREFQIVRPAVLFPTEKYIPRNRPLDSCQKPAVFRQKADCYIVFRTKPHQIWAARYIAKADDSADRMNRYAEPDFSADLDDDRFSFLREIGPLCGHKKGIEVLFHGVSIIRVK
jgi:hypothetical protein